MAAQGATIVDPVDLPEFETVSVLIQEFPDHLDEYLASFDAPRANTVEVFLSGLVHPVIEAIIGVSLAARDTSSDSYFAKLEWRAQMRQLVEAEMDRLALDALVYPPVGEPAQPTGQLQSSPCAFSATTSMPSIVVPAGFVDTAPPLPVGIEIFGRKWDESRLFEIAYAYEQATRHRAPPPGYGALAP
jgi:amidase